MEERKIFEDYPTVDCNTCDNYWNSQCDGVIQPRECKHYVATRKVYIPLEIARLEKKLKSETIYSNILFGLIIIILTLMILGG